MSIVQEEWGKESCKIYFMNVCDKLVCIERRVKFFHKTKIDGIANKILIVRKNLAIFQAILHFNGTNVSV